MTYIDNHLQRVSSHEQAEGEAPLTEPEIVSSDFVTGGCFEVSTSTVRFTFWEEVQSINGEMAERRINSRIGKSWSPCAERLLGTGTEAIGKSDHGKPPLAALAGFSLQNRLLSLRNLSEAFGPE